MRDMVHKAIAFLANDIARHRSALKTGRVRVGLLLLAVAVVGGFTVSLLLRDAELSVYWALFGTAVLLFILSGFLIRERSSLAVLLYVMGLSSAFVSALLVLFSFV